MGRYISIEKWVDIDVDMDDFDTDELVEELKRRGSETITSFTVNDDNVALLTAIFHKKRQGLDYTRELDELIYANLGRIE